MYYSSVSTSQQDALYAIRGGSIFFWPVPNWTASVQLDFIPVYTTLSMDTDTFDAVNGYEEYIIVDVLTKCAAKASDDPGPWLRQREEMERRIRAAGDIDQGSVKTVTNVWGFWGNRGQRRYRGFDW